MGCGFSLAYCDDCIHAIHSGHPQIEESDIGAAGEELVDRFLPVAGLCNHSQRRSGFTEAILAQP